MTCPTLKSACTFGSLILGVSLLATALCASSLAPPARANDWVVGNVAIVEDYGSYNSGIFQVLITLTNKTYYSAASATYLAPCTERFRVVSGLEGVTEEQKKRIYAAALAAHVAKMWLYVNPAGAYQGFCPVQIGSIGDL